MYSNFQERLKARNPDVLYEIKKLLRSRSSETKLSAVNEMEYCLKSEPLTSKCPLREFMLEEDMVGFLCDAMATNSWSLLERLTHVLELLSDSDKMLLEGHAVVAVEAAQRRAHFLGLMVSSANTECEAALRAILNLISTLFERWSELRRPGQCVSNLCPPQGVLSTLRLVLDARCTSPSTAQCATLALCYLLPLLSVGSEPGDPNGLAVSIATCVRSATRRLQRMLLQDVQDVQDGEQDIAVEDEAEERKRLAEQACAGLCAIATRVTRMRADCQQLTDVDCDDALRTVETLESEVQQVIVDKCLPMVVKTARTLIESSEEDQKDQTQISLLSQSLFLEDIGEGQPAMTNLLLDSLLTSLKQGKDAAALADTMACQGFLWLLPELHRTESCCQALQLLCSMLAHLAVDLLDAATWWGGGAEELGDFLYTALPLLPDVPSPGVREWARVLEWGYLPLAPLNATASTASTASTGSGPGPRSAVQLLVLLHTYFRAVVGSDFDQEGHHVLNRSLTAYVLSLPSDTQRRVPTSVLKMVWVSFAVNCVLATDSMAESEKADRAASFRLAQLLAGVEADGTLAAAFTPHPCLLYWAFQVTAVSPRMQQAVLELWLTQSDARDASDASEDAVVITAPVLEILVAHRQAVHPLLDVVTSAPKQAADIAARILHQAASKHPAVAADLGAGLWGRLPLSLSRCGGGCGAGGAILGVSSVQDVQDPDADGCGLLVWLAAEVYQPPPADMAIRVANLLGGVLGRQRLAVPRHLTSAMYILGKMLEDSRSRSDPRVHATLLSDARFAKAILSAAGDADVQVSAMALNLLRHLEEDNALLKAPVVLSATPLEIGTLLLAVSCRDLQVVEAGLLLLVEVLTAKPHPFLVLEDNEDIMRSVYFTLQNQALKVRGARAARDAVWRALKGLLQRSPMLCQQPWNHVLIKLNLKQASLDSLDQLGTEFFAFVLEWLRQLAPPEPPVPTPRRPMPTMLTETLIEIAAALVESGPAFQKRTIVRDLADALLRVTANLPPSLMSSMQGFATK